MIEILGFATVVTILSVSLFMPLVLAFPVAVAFMTGKISENSSSADRVLNYFCNTDTGNSDTIKLLNKFEVSFGWSVVVAIASIFFSFIVCVIYAQNNYLLSNRDPITFIDIFTKAGDKFGPVIGWLAAAGITYFIIVYAGRHIFKFGVRINNLLNNLDDKKASHNQDEK